MNDASILIVEDESIIALEIAMELQKSGFSVLDMVDKGEDALRVVMEQQPDLVMMDIMINGEMDGIETVEKIRKVSDLPVIYLTAYADEKTLERAIATDPEGYLVKPFNSEELAATIKLALYRYAKQENKVSIPEGPRVIELGKHYSFDEKSRQLRYGENPIKLTKKETQLLELLIEYKGNMVPFETIEYQLWPENSVNDSSRRTLIYRLRSKTNHELIETQSGVGCRLYSTIE